MLCCEFFIDVFQLRQPKHLTLLTKSKFDINHSQISKWRNRRETKFIQGYAVIDVNLKDVDAKNKDGLKICKYSIEDHDY